MIPPATTVGYFIRDIELPNPVEEHLGTSRWQTCNCQTCQEKRIKYDSMPGKQIDWERYKRSSDWKSDAIFYVGGRDGSPDN